MSDKLIIGFDPGGKDESCLTLHVDKSALVIRDPFASALIARIDELESRIEERDQIIAEFQAQSKAKRSFTAEENERLKTITYPGDAEEEIRRLNWRIRELEKW